MLREQTIILGNKPVTLENVGNDPIKFTSRSDIKRHLKASGLYSPYFS